MKNKLEFFTIMLLMAVFFVGLISYVFDLSGWTFYLEMIVLVGLLLLGTVSLLLVFNKINGGYMLSALVTAVALINLVLLYMKKGMSSLMFASLVAAIAAFMLSIMGPGREKKEPAPKKEKVVLKTYTPGKVVSSKRAKYFHAPKCEWAKRIKKKNQVWYDSAEEAKSDNLEPHDCV